VWPTFTVGSSTVNPETARTGQPVAISTTVTADMPTSGIVVDLEVYNATNAKVAQAVHSGEAFDAGTARRFTWTWPGSKTPGIYTVRVGVFNADWSTLHKWEPAAAEIQVRPRSSR
jgi:hypothetical protein